jgi:hypothetical protein
MEAGALGSSPLGNLLPLPRLANAPAHGGNVEALQISADQVLAIFHDLSPADLTRLTKIADSAQDGSTHLEISHPSPAEPQQILHQLTAIARLDAEARLGQAEQEIAAGAPKRLADWDARPETLVLVANRLLDAGGHANYLRSSQLSQVVIDAYHQTPPVVDPNFPLARIPNEGAAADPGSASPSAASILWTGLRTGMRTGAPLLVLLIGWLALGLVGGGFARLMRAIWPEQFSDWLAAAAFDLWGLGFLALVGLGFYLRVRKITF